MSKGNEMRKKEHNTNDKKKDRKETREHLRKFSKYFDS